MNKPLKVSRYQDDLHGSVMVVEHEHGMFATNAKPDTNGKWINRGNTYKYVLTPNRAARRAK